MFLMGCFCSHFGHLSHSEEHFTVAPDSRLTGAGLWLLWSLMATLPYSLDVVLFCRLTVLLLAAGLGGSAAGGGSGGVGSRTGAGGGGVGAGGIGVATGLLGM